MERSWNSRDMGDGIGSSLEGPLLSREDTRDVSLSQESENILSRDLCEIVDGTGDRSSPVEDVLDQTQEVVPSGKVVQLISLSIPVVVSNVMSFVISLICVAFVGRMISGECALAASILATTIFNATGLSLLSGCTSALETISGNAYGMGRYETVGQVLVKALVLDAILCSSILLFWMYGVEPLLLLYMGRGEYVSLACRYVRILSPGLPLSAIFESLKRYLGCQRIVRPVTWSTGIAFILCPVYNYILINLFSLDGAALAQVSIMLTQTAALVSMTIIIDMRKATGMPKTWTGISWDALTNIDGYSEFLRLAVPGLFMILSEWWAFETLVILAGMLPSGDPKVYIAVMGVMVQLSGLVWTIVSAVCFAGSILISTSLGQNCPRQSQKYARELFKVSLLIEICMATMLIVLRDSVGWLFTSSENIATSIAHTIPIFAMTLVPDGINIPIQSILKACGQQHTGALLNVLYWAIVPFGMFLGIHCNLLLNGLWTSILIVNLALCGILSVSYNTSIHFDTEATKACQRVRVIENSESSFTINRR